jgi:hypothetical protein
MFECVMNAKIASPKVPLLQRRIVPEPNFVSEFTRTRVLLTVDRQTGGWLSADSWREQAMSYPIDCAHVE